MFQELYAAADERIKRRDIPTEEKEYKNQYQECTFKPDLTATRGRSHKHLQRRKVNQINGVKNMLKRYTKAKRLQSEEKEAITSGRHVNDGPRIESQRHFYTQFQAR